MQKINEDRILISAKISREQYNWLKSKDISVSMFIRSAVQARINAQVKQEAEATEYKPVTAAEEDKPLE